MADTAIISCALKAILILITCTPANWAFRWGATTRNAHFYYYYEEVNGIGTRVIRKKLVRRYSFASILKKLKGQDASHFTSCTQSLSITSKYYEYISAILTSRADVRQTLPHKLCNNFTPPSDIVT